MDYKVLTIKYNNDIYTLSDEKAVINDVYSGQLKYKYNGGWMPLYGPDGKTQHEKVTIHSVERNDGVIFTLGDEITHKEKQWGNGCKIIKFEIRPDYIGVGNSSNGFHDLNNLVKVHEYRPNTWSVSNRNSNPLDIISSVPKHGKSQNALLYQEQMRMYNQAVFEMNKHMEAEMDRIEAEFWFGKPTKKMLLLTKKRRHG